MEATVALAQMYQASCTNAFVINTNRAENINCSACGSFSLRECQENSENALNPHVPILQVEDHASNRLCGDIVLLPGQKLPNYDCYLEVRNRVKLISEQCSR